MPPKPTSNGVISTFQAEQKSTGAAMDQSSAFKTTPSKITTSVSSSLASVTICESLTNGINCYSSCNNNKNTLTNSKLLSEGSLTKTAFSTPDLKFLSTTNTTSTFSLINNATNSNKNAESPQVTQISVDFIPENNFHQSDLRLQNKLLFGNESNNVNAKELLINESKSKISLFTNSFGRMLDKNMANVVSLQRECIHMLESFHELKDQLYSFETEMKRQLESLAFNSHVTSSTCSENHISNAVASHSENDRERPDSHHHTNGIFSQQTTSTMSNYVPLEKPQNENVSNTTTTITNEYDIPNHQTINKNIDQHSKNNKQLPEISDNQQIHYPNQEINTILSHQNQEITQNHHENNSSLSPKHDRNQPPDVETSLKKPASTKTPSHTENEQDESFTQSTYIFSPRRASSDEASSTASSSDQNKTNNNKGKSTLDSVLSSMNFHPKRKSCSQSNTPSSSAPVKKKPFSPTQQQQNKMVIQKQTEFVQNLKSLQVQGRNNGGDQTEYKLPNPVLSIPSTSDEDNGDVFSSNEDPTMSSSHEPGQRQSSSMSQINLLPQPPPDVRIKEEIFEEDEGRVSEDSNVNFEISSIQKNSCDLWSSSSTTGPFTTNGACNGEASRRRDDNENEERKFTPNIFGQRYDLVLC